MSSTATSTILELPALPGYDNHQLRAYQWRAYSCHSFFVGTLS